MTQQDTLELPKALRTQFERSGVALALSGTGPDVPLLLVNSTFCRLTGYEASDVVGRNCRFLQGEATSDEEQRALHDFVHDERIDAGRFPVTNYRKDGSRFLNFVFMTRLRNRSGVARYILASQFDLTDPDRRVRLRQNDGELGQHLGDIETVGHEYGLAMIGSAKILADSVATLARLTLDDTLR